jgi:hypothetical protein
MLVTLHVWRVPGRHLGGALLRMARDPRRLRALPGVRFAKMLGTGRGRTFGPGDADPTRYAALVVWDSEPASAEVDRGWRRIADRSARIDLEPLHSRGRWSGQEPFDPPARTDGGNGPVLALTRARLRPVRALTFWRCVPPVVAELDASPGLLARFGIGEAPIGWQGTVTVWRSTTDLTAFAYRQPEHRKVIARTPTDGWYAEDLFARFAVRDVHGDRAVLGWTEREGGQTTR